MKIIRLAIPSVDDRGLESSVNEHFGRAPFYTFVDVSDSGKILNVEVVPVPFEEHGPGDIPYWLKEQGTNVVLALGIGGRAIDHFSQVGIEVIRGVTGKIEDIVKGFLSGTLVTIEWEGGGEGHHEHGQRHHH